MAKRKTKLCMFCKSKKGIKIHPSLGKPVCSKCWEIVGRKIQ